jgi:hypothetical protein
MILFCSAGYVETVYSCDTAIGLPDVFKPGEFVY